MATSNCPRCNGTGYTRWRHVQGGVCFRCNGRGVVGSVRGAQPSRLPAPAPAVPAEDIRIEFPSRGATYNHNEYGVYKYDTYPRSSVLAGQTRRQWLGRYDTLAEAQAAHPTATTASCGYQAPYLGHLSDDGDPEPVEEDGYGWEDRALRGGRW